MERDTYIKEEIDILVGQLKNQILQLEQKIIDIKASQVRDISDQWNYIAALENKMIQYSKGNQGVCGK